MQEQSPLWTGLLGRLFKGDLNAFQKLKLSLDVWKWSGRHTADADDADDIPCHKADLWVAITDRPTSIAHLGAITRGVLQRSTYVFGKLISFFCDCLHGSCVGDYLRRFVFIAHVGLCVLRIKIQFPMCPC